MPMGETSGEEHGIAKRHNRSRGFKMVMSPASFREIVLNLSVTDFTRHARSTWQTGRPLSEANLTR